MRDAEQQAMSVHLGICVLTSATAVVWGWGVPSAIDAKESRSAKSERTSGLNSSSSSSEKSSSSAGMMLGCRRPPTSLDNHMSRRRHRSTHGHDTNADSDPACMERVPSVPRFQHRHQTLKPFRSHLLDTNSLLWPQWVHLLAWQASGMLVPCSVRSAASGSESSAP